MSYHNAHFLPPVSFDSAGPSLPDQAIINMQDHDYGAFNMSLEVSSRNC
jgi:hypothetical protein